MAGVFALRLTNGLNNNDKGLRITQNQSFAGGYFWPSWSRLKYQFYRLALSNCNSIQWVVILRLPRKQRWSKDLLRFGHLCLQDPFKEVDIENRDFPSDFSPKVKIVTPLFFFENKNFRPFSISCESQNFEFQKKI